MKKFIFIISLLLISNYCQAADNSIYPITKDIVITKDKQGFTSIKIICVGGYKFLVTRSINDNMVSISTIQIYKQNLIQLSSPAVPIKCNE